MQQRQQRPKRERSRGTAALELALSLVFLMPLMLSTLDFGYYFYIGANVQEAARAGVRQAVKMSVGNCLASNAAVQANNVPAVGSGTACVGGAAYCYMNEPPLALGGAGTPRPTNVLLECLNVPVNPTWRITVTTDFAPAVGFVAPLLPSGGTGKVRYRAVLVSN
jgi:Flp pilus assembly protein TadG